MDRQVEDGHRWAAYSLTAPVIKPPKMNRVRKRAKYLSMGAEYWIVDLDARVIEVWRPGSAQPTVEDRRAEWTAPGASEALTVDLESFFRRVFRELSR